MTDNAITTHDDASNYASQLVKMLSFSHEGAAGSTSFSFGVSKTTAYDNQNSSTSAMLDDGALGSSSSQTAGSAGGGSTGGGTSDPDNALTTSDHASSYTSQWQKVLTFTHEGAAGSTGFSLGESKMIHCDSQQSDTSALFGNGWGGSSGQIGGGSGCSTGTGSGGTDVCETGSGGGDPCGGGSTCGGSGGGGSGGGYPGGGGSGGGYPGGNLITTHDRAISFDQQFVKTLSFAHEGAAGSTGFNFGTSHAVHWDSQQSDTAALFDDGLFGSGGMLDQLAHQGSSSALIG